jgi:prohibitin 2
MAEKLNDFASRLSKGTPKGLGLSVSLLAGTTAAIYGIYRSMFTGNFKREREKLNKLYCFLVEGGHRAIIFNRIGGVDQNTIHAEGLHFR